MYVQHYWKNKVDGTVLHVGGSMPEEWEQMPAAHGRIEHRKSIADQLRKDLTPGQTVYCVLRHVSASGMSRRISLFIVEGGAIRCIDYAAAIAMGDKVSDKGGISVSGCGTDMGFHLVYNLGMALWPLGTDAPHSTRNGQPDHTGGYALKSTWL